MLFTMHASVMIFLVIIPVLAGAFGNFLIPLQIGADDMAFPVLNMLSYWFMWPAIFCFGYSFIAGGATAGPANGWTSYPVLSDIASASPSSGEAQTWWLFGLTLVGVSSMMGSVNYMTTIINMRAPGMTLFRMPLTIWSMFITAILQAFALPVLTAAGFMLVFDRLHTLIPTSIHSVFFVPAGLVVNNAAPTVGGGQPLLWQHLFWFYSHPAVYIMILPGMAVVSEILATFSRRAIFGYFAVAMSSLALALVGFLVWAHHMYATGWMPSLNGPFMVTTEMISVPTGLLFLVLLGTLWRGKPWMKLPMLGVFALLWNFLIGGITGIYLSDVPADDYLHGSMFVTAHFHYTLMGAALTGAIAGLAYWFPKMTGRMLHERSGYISFWLVQIGFQVLFLGMFAAGSQGQPRRVADYTPDFDTSNLISTIGAYTVGLGMIVLLWSVVHSWRKGAVAPMNPWGAKTLEWSVPNPIPLENFDQEPIVSDHPYTYGKVKS